MNFSNYPIALTLFIHVWAAVGIALSIITLIDRYYIRPKQQQQPQPQQPQSAPVLPVMYLKVGDHTLYISLDTPDDMALKQVTFFATAVMEGYEKEDTTQGYRMAAMIRDYIARLPIDLPMMMERQRQVLRTVTR